MMPDGMAVSAEQNAFPQLGRYACPATCMRARETEVLIDRIDVMCMERCVTLAIAAVDAFTAEEHDDLDLQFKATLVDPARVA